MKVAVLMGGHSAEREISLKTGRGVAQALRKLGYEVAAVDAADGRLLPAGDEEGAAPPAALAPAQPVQLVSAQAMQEAEVVFVALHGGAGEDGTLQALLELAGKPYTGSGVLASALAMNKAMAKRLFEHAGIPTPRWRLFDARGEQAPKVFDARELGGYPVVVKPNAQGSTVGLTVVQRAEGLPAALEEAARFGDEVLVEEYIPGREVTVGVLGGEALPVVEIVPSHGLYDFECKYTPGMSEYRVPAPLEPEQARTLQQLGCRAFRALGCRGVARVDFRLSPAGEPFCLEVNTIPGMTPTSLVPMAARAVGISYDQLVGRMLELALEDARRQAARPVEH
jgi:D-alanine-D-alanine ligase